MQSNCHKPLGIASSAQPAAPSPSPFSLPLLLYTLVSLLLSPLFTLIFSLLLLFPSPSLSFFIKQIQQKLVDSLLLFFPPLSLFLSPCGIHCVCVMCGLRSLPSSSAPASAFTEHILIGCQRLTLLPHKSYPHMSPPPTPSCSTLKLTFNLQHMHPRASTDQPTSTTPLLLCPLADPRPLQLQTKESC